MSARTLYDQLNKMTVVVADTGDINSSAEDPGVVSATQIYNYYKKLGYDTEIHGRRFSQPRRAHGAHRVRSPHDRAEISVGLVGENRRSSAQAHPEWPRVAQVGCAHCVDSRGKDAAP